MSYSQLVEFETWTHSDVLTFPPPQFIKKWTRRWHSVNVLYRSCPRPQWDNPLVTWWSVASVDGVWISRKCCRVSIPSACPAWNRMPVRRILPPSQLITSVQHARPWPQSRISMIFPPIFMWTPYWKFYIPAMLMTIFRLLVQWVDCVALLLPLIRTNPS